MGGSSSPLDAPTSRTIFRNAETGRVVSADVAAADKKGHVAEALQPHYNATVVNASARASGVRLTLDVDISPTQLDFITSTFAKAKVSFSV